MIKLRSQKGITLVALVITIIILIILAGISINILLGEGGLINKAQQGAENYKTAEAAEQTLLGEIENTLNSISTGGTPTTSKKYTLGQEVTVGGEQFFVIEEDDTESKNTITLITKYNLNPSSNEQLNAAFESTAMAFCTDPDNTSKGYWYEEGESSSKYPYELNGVENERATAYNKAVAYADEIKTKTGNTGTVTGRLLTRTEAKRLTAEGKIPKIICGQDYTTNRVTTDNFLNYWLGTAYNYNSPYTAYSVYGFYGDRDSYPFYDDGRYGVRPVITVSKSLVSE